MFYYWYGIYVFKFFILSFFNERSSFIARCFRRSNDHEETQTTVRLPHRGGSTMTSRAAAQNLRCVSASASTARRRPPDDFLDEEDFPADASGPKRTRSVAMYLSLIHI